MNAVDFDLDAYLLTLPDRLLDHPEGRRALTELDPMAFALTYLPHHLQDESTSAITFSEFHIALCEQAKGWITPLRSMRQHRDAYIAPRECGKSTWLFLILPMWAAAHGHLRFIAAFADSATQAEQHLATFKHELDANPLLNADFPELCEPARQTRVSRQLAQNRGQIQQSNGFVFMARGIDSANLGMKVGSMRPQVLIMDDIEPDESNYSVHQMEKRLGTVRDAILPLNNFARVVLIGTVTMHGSIVHQLVQSVTRQDQQEVDWITEENFRVHYFPAVLDNGDGTERSIWPEKWPLGQLVAMRGTRTFAKNFMNQPVDQGGAFWSREDIKFGKPDGYGMTILSVDPAVTSKVTSDYTGLAVISRGLGEKSDTLYVRYANHVKLPPQQLRDLVVRILEEVEDIGAVLIETNQGGDAWLQILHGLPVPVRTVHQSSSKAVRAQQVLNFYQRGKVFHTKALPVLEDELVAFPNALHDDTLDATCTGILQLQPRKKQKTSAKQMSYI